MLLRAIVLGLLTTFTLGLYGCGSDDDGGSSNQPQQAAYPSQDCVGSKQDAAATYCRSVFEAWAGWETTADAAARDAEIQGARNDLSAAWADAEQASLDQGADCADLALGASEAADIIGSRVGGIVVDVNAGLDLDRNADARCGSDILRAAATKCDDILVAQSRHIRDLAGDPDRAELAAALADANRKFSKDWDDAVRSGCPTSSTEGGVSDAVDSLTARVVLDTTVSPHLDSEVFATISPTGTTEYLGNALTPVCMEGSAYHFFARRGTVNKLVMYYQGGGACWEGLTCSIPVCNDNVDPETDNPTRFASGFGDTANTDNPFRDWHTVYVSYCSCDVHAGDSAQDYALGDGVVHVEHRGFYNSQIAEKWAREHFLDPEVVFVTGSSAGAYGAWFNAVPLQDVWPASRFHVLADAGNGVITREFLDGPFQNWNFEAHLPEYVPGVREALIEGTGIPGYTEAVAAYFPHTNWAHYSTSYDGGNGGQTGFYNIMLNGNDPIAALSWWDASCAFNEVMQQQSIDISIAVPENYRYYIGSGSRHTMWGSNKVYSDTTGGVPTIVDWVGAMLASQPGQPDPGWSNVECADCSLTLPGDPTPPKDNLQPPFEQHGDEIIINCNE
jgi:hypothetical protein